MADFGPHAAFLPPHFPTTRTTPPAAHATLLQGNLTQERIWKSVAVASTELRGFCEVSSH